MHDPNPITSILTQLSGVSASPDWESIEARRKLEDEHFEQRKADARAEWAQMRAEGRVDHAWRSAVLECASGVLAFADRQRVARGEARVNRAVDAAQRWLRHPKPILVLYGNPGTGKTVAAHVAAVEWARYAARERETYYRDCVSLDPEKRLSEFRADMLRWSTARGCRVVPSPDLPMRFKPWRGEASESPLDMKHPLVLIDDMGSENLKSGRWHEAFGQVLNARLACDPAKVRTIITTNLKREEIAAEYGARVEDRFREHAAFVACAGESMRGAQS